MNVFDRMDEEGKKSGYLKMNPTDDKTIQVLTDPVEGVNEFQGKSRAEFKLEVLDLKTQEKLIWAIRQKGVMQQIVAIQKANHLQTLVGQRLQLNTTGTDAIKKAWFIRLLQPQQGQILTSPGMSAQGQTPPVTGQAWVESQKIGSQ